ncbi:MAG: NAD(P)H-hydrate epimerase [Acidimicrobiia bacterium]|nr:NAD(P)H-hydrate epimerase [Acidimicrobiia bacterium]
MPDTVAFQTDDARPVPAVTTDEMREIDRLAIDVHGPNLYQMMENAGRNLAATAIEMLGEAWTTKPIVVLAGTGGNGGGGIAGARHLANREANVTLAVTNPSRLGEVPASQLRVYTGTEGRLVAFEALNNAEPPALVIDAAIGYSLSGPPRGPTLEMIEFANATSAAVLSLDTPSGLDTTTGDAPGTVVQATTTMTLALPKVGLRSNRAGALILADIGIPPIVYRDAGIQLEAPIFDHRFRIPIHSTER